MKHLALLRGINVSGKNMIKMPVLVGIFSELGCKDVCTYIQSGNVLFSASKTIAAKLESAVESAIGTELGLRIPVLVRSAAEFSEAVAANPFPEAVDSPRQLHLVFLKDKPEAEAVASLDPDRSAPDRFVVADRHIYMHLGRSAADTKLTNAYFDARLKTVSTARNWNTVKTLQDLLQSARFTGEEIHQNR